MSAATALARALLADRPVPRRAGPAVPAPAARPSPSPADEHDALLRRLTAIATGEEPATAGQVRAAVALLDRQGSRPSNLPNLSAVSDEELRRMLAQAQDDAWRAEIEDALAERAGGASGMVARILVRIAKLPPWVLVAALQAQGVSLDEVARLMDEGE